MELIGRENEQATFKHCLQSTESKLLAVYGRRRVGKTFLIRNHFQGRFKFEISGLHLGDMNDQLDHFTKTISRSGYKAANLALPKSWMEAFSLLTMYLDTLKGKEKKVLFFDELPWFDTPRSKFLMAFENFWNSYCSKRKDLLVIICGSAASWMIKKIMQNKGGLHNRVSEKIDLQPFTLNETAQFLKHKGIKWGQYDITQLYMTTGGVPYYLDAVRKGESVIQFIDRACFQKNGLLYNEYEELYTSLFDESEHHRLVVETLANVKQGQRRDQIIANTGLSSGGTLTKVLNELETSGFIRTVLPYGVNKNKALYRLEDYFSIFYFKFMNKKGRRQKDSWTKIVKGQSWQSWSGLAFERICMHHLDQIKKVLGLSVIESEISSWQNKSTEPGAQIDLLIDRSDRVINVCEIKFATAVFSIDKAYAANLRNKLDAFSKIAPKKNLFLTMITTFGTSDNEYYKELVQSEVTLEDLFKK